MNEFDQIETSFCDEIKSLLGCHCGFLKKLTKVIFFKANSLANKIPYYIQSL
jgi:hypothetical protein